MTELLLIVGLFVFFISVYGAVMVGGYLLEELEQADQTPAPHSSSDENHHDVATAASSQEH